MKPARSVLATPFLALAVACSGPPANAPAAYQEGRYEEALRQLIAAQPEALEHPGGPPARYCLYRGLAHLALDDGRRAEGWLRCARRRLVNDPWSLDRDERGRLATAWRTLGHAAGDP